MLIYAQIVLFDYFIKIFSWPINVALLDTYEFWFWYWFILGQIWPNLVLVWTHILVLVFDLDLISSIVLNTAIKWNHCGWIRWIRNTALIRQKKHYTNLLRPSQTSVHSSSTMSLNFRDCIDFQELCIPLHG